MKAEIVLAPNVAVTLEAVRNVVENQEFSGFGFCNQTEKGLYVYDFVLLDVGTWGYTEIPTSEIVALMDRKDAAKMKVWVHRHPLGNGKPGPHNWSGMDQTTIMTQPLGGIPELVKWSASIVFTPKGWVGRIDNHLAKQTIHVPVYPKIKWGTVIKAEDLYADFVNSQLAKKNIFQPDLFNDDDDFLSPEEIEDYLEGLDEDERAEKLDSLEFSQTDMLLSQMHVASVHSHGGILHHEVIR